MTFALNLSEEDFTRELEAIDQLMVSADVKISARSIRGWMLFCHRMKLEGISFTHPISEKVMEWFHTRYGQRLNLDSDFGHSVLLLRGDIIRFRCPLFYGRALMMCVPELLEHDFNHIEINRPTMVNVLKRMDGITSTYSQSLTPDERRYSLERVTQSEILLARIGDAGIQRFVPEGRADIRTSVEQLMLNERQFGPSKWSSSQSVEKFLKAYISQQGIEPRRIHELDKLADRAESLGLKALNKSSLSIVQCIPDARYDTSSVTKAEAVKAHQVAISICAEIASQLKGRSDWRTGAIERGFLSLNDKAERIPTILIARINQRIVFTCEIEADP